MVTDNNPNPANGPATYPPNLKEMPAKPGLPGPSRWSSQICSTTQSTGCVRSGAFVSTSSTMGSFARRSNSRFVLPSWPRNPAARSTP